MVIFLSLITTNGYFLYQVDPFLHLVEDCKLQVNHLTKVYGSKEDDSDALNSVSAISVTEKQSKEYLTSLIVKSLTDLSDVTPHINYLVLWHLFLFLIVIH